SVPLHLHCSSHSEPSSPSSGGAYSLSLSLSPPAFLLSERFHQMERLPPDELERTFHAWLNLDSPSDVSCSERKCSTITVSSPEGVNNLEMSAADPLGAAAAIAALTDDCEELETDLRRAKKKGTNLYGRPYCPGRPLSMKERLQIIQFHSSGMKVNAISKSLCISHGCVSKIITRYRSTGVLAPVSSPEHRKQRRRKNASEGAAPSGASLGPASAEPCTSAGAAAPATPPAAGPASVPTPQLAQLSPLPQPLLLHPLGVPQLQSPVATMLQPHALHFIDHQLQQQPQLQPPPPMMYTDPTGSTYSFLQPMPTSHLHSLSHDYTTYSY
ncbi:hypothetical protein PFISCL1PPCAC_13146, partial [Pristionchus fissidentatus]